MIQTAYDFATSDTFDSRDVIETIAEMERLADEHDESEDHDDDLCPRCDDTAQAHLDALKNLEDEASGYISDWSYGEQFIADDYFEQFAESYADEIGAISDDRHGSTPWPLMHIDWKAAADDLKQDYTSFDLLGHTFWAR